MSNIAEQLENNKQLLSSIDEIASMTTISMDDYINNIEYCRNMLFFGFFRNSLSHYQSINILVKESLYNSAFSLIRILFENIIKAQYMYYIVDDDAINELYNGNKWKNTFTGMEQMCKDIDKVLGEEVYLPLKKRYYKDMCDYTHTGIIQMSCNFNEEKGTIEPNFSNHLVVNTLSGIYALTRLFAIAFFENISLTKGFITHRQIDNFIEST